MILLQGTSPNTLSWIQFSELIGASPVYSAAETTKKLNKFGFGTFTGLTLYADCSSSF